MKKKMFFKSQKVTEKMIVARQKNHSVLVFLFSIFKSLNVNQVIENFIRICLQPGFITILGIFSRQNTEEELKYKQYKTVNPKIPASYGQ